MQTYVFQNHCGSIKSNKQTETEKETAKQTEREKTETETDKDREKIRTTEKQTDSVEMKLNAKFFPVEQRINETIKRTNG